MEFIKVDVFADTGEVVERPMTDEEISEIMRLRQEDEAKKAELKTKIEKRAELLNRLGITEEEARLFLS